MATKTVTLKDSNGDTLYPVTDSNVVNINQQKTLAQALDGVVYAEDPTQNATPTAWVTGSDINWTTLSENQSDIRKIHYDTFTATTDSNGFANVPTNLVTLSTGMILAVATTARQCFTTPFNDINQSRYTIKTEEWNGTSISNASVTYHISYILY